MQIETHIQGTVLHVRLLDRALDAYASAGFRERLAELVRQGHARIVLDLGAVDFLDSSGLGAVIACHRMLEGSGSLALCGCNPGVLQVLRLARLDRLVTIAGDAEQAAAALSGG